MQISILFANKIALYLNIIFSDAYGGLRQRTFCLTPHKIALLPTTFAERLAEKEILHTLHRAVGSLHLPQAVSVGICHKQEAVVSQEL